MKTKAVGVRIPVDLLDRAKAAIPGFNLSSFVRCALEERFVLMKYKILYGTIDGKHFVISIFDDQEIISPMEVGLQRFFE